MKKILTFIFFIMAGKFYCQVNIPVTDSCACSINVTVLNTRDIEIDMYGYLVKGITRLSRGATFFTNEIEFRNYYLKFFSSSQMDSLIQINNIDFNSNNLILFWSWTLSGIPQPTITVSNCSDQFLQLNAFEPFQTYDVNEPAVKYIIIPKYINQIKQIKVCVIYHQRPLHEE